MKKKHKIKTVPRDAAWTPFRRCSCWLDAIGNREEIPSYMLALRNSIYTVHVEQCEDVAPFGQITWLSIKRNDRRAIHDWRDLQRIKNEICGAEREAVEIYPAESRPTDTANQYHLWVMPSSYQLPFGYSERLVASDGAIDPSNGIAAQQRPFKPGEAPSDVMTGEAITRRFSVDPSFGARLVHRRRTDIEWEAK